jgi:hypothetical protein
MEGSPVEPAVFVLKTGFWHRNPGLGMHALTEVGLEKTPRKKREASTTAIMSIDHPYVIRYSIAA